MSAEAEPTAGTLEIMKEHMTKMKVNHCQHLLQKSAILISIVATDLHIKYSNCAKMKTLRNS